MVALVAYTITTKKDWKIPALEIIMRALYEIALISGGMILSLQGFFFRKNQKKEHM